jgi:hypothetical protein
MGILFLFSGKNGGLMEKIRTFKVFISYSRKEEDRAIAGLLANALKNVKNENNEENISIIPFYDEGLYSGFSISEKVEKKIREADVILQILTKNAEESQWVNQELGYAKALYKTIIPVLINSSLQPSGLLYGYKPFECFNWFEIENVIARLSAAISNAVDERSPAPIVIQNEIERTIEIIKQLDQIDKELEKSTNIPDQQKKQNNSMECSYLNNNEIQLYERSTLSIFSFDRNISLGGYSTRYLDLLCKQNELMKKIVKNPLVKTRLHICPFAREYPQGVREKRLACLLDWLEVNKNNTSLKLMIKIDKQRGPNTLAVKNMYAFEGLQTRKDSEYEYTLSWRYPSEKIDFCFIEFASNEGWLLPKEAATVIKLIKLLSSDKAKEFIDKLSALQNEKVKEKIEKIDAFLKDLPEDSLLQNFNLDKL